MSYRARIAALDFERSLATPARSRIALLTGQSSFLTSRLTPQQLDFITQVAPVDAKVLPLGFPFHPDLDCVAPLPGMLGASLRNALQFVWSATSPSYIAQALQPLWTNTSDRLYLVTGSCGLQLLTHAWPLLIKPQTLKIRIVALGPAGAVLPGAVTIQGDTDLWSRLLYRGPITARCKAGHLDYWTSAEARALTARLLNDAV